MDPLGRVLAGAVAAWGLASLVDPVALAGEDPRLRGAVDGAVDDARGRDEAADPCSPGAPGCGWEAGDMLTHSQTAWGNPMSPAGTLLENSFATVYPADSLVVGIPGAGGFTITLDGVAGVTGYLPSSGAPGPLNADMMNPMTTSSGSFGGEVAALDLNVKFSDAGLLAGAANTRVGDLRICGYALAPTANGQTVRQFLDTANTLLGAGAAAISHDQADALANVINGAFTDGQASGFAEANLVAASACPPSLPPWLALDFEGSPATGPFGSADWFGIISLGECGFVFQFQDRARTLDDEYASLGLDLSPVFPTLISGGFNPDGTGHAGDNSVLSSEAPSTECPAAVSGLAPLTLRFDYAQTDVAFDVFMNLAAFGTSFPVSLLDASGAPFDTFTLTVADAIIPGNAGGRFQVSSATPFFGIQIGLTTTGGGPETGGFYFDNLQLLPEPSAPLQLLTGVIALVALAARRSRRAQRHSKPVGGA